MGKTSGKFGFVKTNVFDQTSKRGQILTKKISPQSEPHTTKLCFSVVLKNYLGNSLKTSLFSQKYDCQKEAQKYQENLFFLTSVKRGKSFGKFIFV